MKITKGRAEAKREKGRYERDSGKRSVLSENLESVKGAMRNWKESNCSFNLAEFYVKMEKTNWECGGML